eukprot:m51a1_g4844 hypothetical protein (190) ;mRNA; f:234412-241930
MNRLKYGLRTWYKELGCQLVWNCPQLVSLTVADHHQHSECTCAGDRICEGICRAVARCLPSTRHRPQEYTRRAVNAASFPFRLRVFDVGASISRFESMAVEMAEILWVLQGRRRGEPPVVPLPKLLFVGVKPEGPGMSWSNSKMLASCAAMCRMCSALETVRTESEAIAGLIRERLPRVTIVGQSDGES